jgi:hypothetical protein
MKTEDTTARRNHRWPLRKAAELIRAGHRALRSSRRRPQMSKAEIVVELETMVTHRLFGCYRWLADQETSSAVHQKLIKMGLLEHISSDTWQNTPLGAELDLDLLLVFMGLFEIREVPLILEHYRLIDERELDSLYECMSTNANPEFVLFGYVRRAYFDYHKITRCLH